MTAFEYNFIKSDNIIIITEKKPHEFFIYDFTGIQDKKNKNMFIFKKFDYLGGEEELYDEDYKKEMEEEYKLII